MKKKDFVYELEKQSERWVSQEVIKEEQRSAIIALAEEEAQKEREEPKKRPAYKPRETKEPKSGTGSLSIILMSLAGVLLSVGIILFYAANWRKMPPSFKLAQIFFLIIGLYSGSFYARVFKEGYDVLGRVLLVMGMVAYGGGIVLVAQIFHISAHPTNGVLAWGVGVFLMSWVTKERWGAYLAAILFWIWSFWEFGQYQNPHYLYIPILAALFFLFYHLKERFGIILVSTMSLIWFLGWNILQLVLSSSGGRVLEIKVFSLVLSALPLGIALVLIGRLVGKNHTLKWGGSFLRGVGWLSVFVTFIGLSWPIKIRTLFPLHGNTSTFIAIEYLGLVLLGSLVHFFLNKREERHPILMAFLGVAVLFFVLPLGNTKVLLVSTHFGLFFFLFGLLWSSVFSKEKSRIEKVMGTLLTVLALITKFVAFLSLGLSILQGYSLGKTGSFFVAYLLGFVIFALLCFLCNQILVYHARKEKHPYTGNAIQGTVSILAFFSFYALSFQIPTQNSVLNANPVILTLLFVFLGLALVLYGYLWFRSEERLPLIVSGVIFIVTVAVLFIAGPQVSWVTYSIIFNALLFLYVLVLLVYSTKINSRILVNFAVMGFILHVTTRYFDLLWDALSGSLLFITTGLLMLIGGTIIEKNRRKLLASFQEPKQKGGNT